MSLVGEWFWQHLKLSISLSKPRKPEIGDDGLSVAGNLDFLEIIISELEEAMSGASVSEGKTGRRFLGVILFLSKPRKSEIGDDGFRVERISV